MMEQLRIGTRDGDCPAFLFAPPRRERSPAIIFYMDGLGMRPALHRMARRLSDQGFVVLLPDLFYRFGPYGPFQPIEVLAGDFHATLGPLLATIQDGDTTEDTRAFLECLQDRPEVSSMPVGTLGFCMGGKLALSAAGRFPAQVAAAASFHGGGLATDSPDSPHSLAAGMRAELYIAAADHDPSFPAEMRRRLVDALDRAGVSYHCETYENAAHGWMMPDFPVFDVSASDRGWSRVLSLFRRAIRKT